MATRYKLQRMNAGQWRDFIVCGSLDELVKWNPDIITQKDGCIFVASGYNLVQEEIPEDKENSVEHPAHYTAGGIECIDAIRASLGNREFADYCKGNILKYLWRYRLKNGVEDLRKAQVYLNWMIEAEESADD